MVCPECEQGTMTTILVIDGQGNVIIDGLPDEAEQLEPIMADTT